MHQPLEVKPKERLLHYVLLWHAFGWTTFVSSLMGFWRALDRATRTMRDHLPREVSSWGLARKVLNIFLRDCFYNGLLMSTYKLKSAERFFEVPLDSVVAQALKARQPRGALPRWRGVKHLSAEESVYFQGAALELCRSLNITRVHLELCISSVAAKRSGTMMVIMPAARGRADAGGASSRARQSCGATPSPLGGG